MAVHRRAAPGRHYRGSRAPEAVPAARAGSARGRPGQLAHWGRTGRPTTLMIDNSPLNVSCLHLPRSYARRYRWTIATIQDSKVPESPATSASHLATGLSYLTLGTARQLRGCRETQDSFIGRRGIGPGPAPSRHRTFW